MTAYFKNAATRTWPRLPMKGSLDLTYRCNNNCRHCWLYQPDTPSIRRNELSLKDWIDIIDQARAMGTREWAISGGEPMLREDFIELFDHITAKSSFYSLNTNGTLITPKIAQKLRRPGDIMVALYGASADVNDHITRNPGSFEQALQGMAYLRECGVRFSVQLVPMKDNFHQWEDMNRVAQNLSPDYRVGAAWLHLSASGDSAKNKEILAQRLTLAQSLELDPPNVSYEQRHSLYSRCVTSDKKKVYQNCILGRNAFHVDPQGGLSFCILVKDERLRYNLKNGSFCEGWEQFLPAKANNEKNFVDISPSCEFCRLTDSCQVCPALSFLENRTLETASSYQCQIEKEKKKYRENWKADHQRFFEIAGVSIAFSSEKAIKVDTFGPSFTPFLLSEPSDDLIQVEHYYSLLPVEDDALGELLYDRAPWRIYRKGELWNYVNYTHDDEEIIIHKIASFSKNYAHGRIYSRSDHTFERGNLHALTMFATDQIWLAPALLPRQAFYIHSCGLIVDGRGMLFIGHSEAGKSTTAKLFGRRAELLCDDRNVVRLWPEQGWRVHGTWSHGEIPTVSSASAPLKGLFFLEQSHENRLIRISNRRDVANRLIPCLVRPLVNLEWWQTILPLIYNLAASIPAYIMQFNLSGEIVPIIGELDLEPTNPDTKTRMDVTLIE